MLLNKDEWYMQPKRYNTIGIPQKNGKLHGGKGEPTKHKPGRKKDGAVQRKLLSQ